MIKNLLYLLYQIYLHRSNLASYRQYKYFFKWSKSLGKNASSIIDEQPWINYEAIDFLKENILNDSKVFEYGGGGSTLFFISKVSELATIEHDESWFKELDLIIRSKKHENIWKGSYIPAKIGDLEKIPDFSNPDHFSSSDPKSKGYNYEEYVKSIDEFPNDYFDFVLIDGRSRPSCIIRSINKIKKSGFLILDNSDRDYYLKQTNEIINKNFILIQNNLGLCPYSNFFTKTGIWKKVT